MLVFDQVSAYYGKKCIVSNLSFRITKGKTTILLGPNGSGKSTLLSLLGYHQARMQGSILLEERKLTSYSVQERSFHLALLPQRFPQVQYDVETLLTYGRFPYGEGNHRLSESDRLKIEAIITTLQLEPLRYRRVASLSGGEQQRVMLGLLQVLDPEILCMDEPLTFLDPQYQFLLLDALQTLKLQKKTMLLVLHDILSSLAIGDEFLVLCQDGIQHFSSVSELLASQILRTVFQLDVFCVDGHYVAERSLYGHVDKNAD
ncbi:MAG: ABC transporter ATP-binding protein [Erysipelotrichaceae bacterium]